jgi:hypothetical protein
MFFGFYKNVTFNSQFLANNNIDNFLTVPLAVQDDSVTIPDDLNTAFFEWMKLMPDRNPGKNDTPQMQAYIE